MYYDFALLVLLSHEELYLGGWSVERGGERGEVGVGGQSNRRPFYPFFLIPSLIFVSFYNFKQGIMNVKVFIYNVNVFLIYLSVFEGFLLIFYGILLHLGKDPKTATCWDLKRVDIIQCSHAAATLLVVLDSLTLFIRFGVKTKGPFSIICRLCDICLRK